MGGTYEDTLGEYRDTTGMHISIFNVCAGDNRGDEMRLKLQSKAYPYLLQDGTIKVQAFYDGDGYYGVPLLGKGEGLPVTSEFDFELPDNPTKTAIDFFDAMKEKERADMQVKIEKIEEAKQMFLALEAPQ